MQSLKVFPQVIKQWWGKLESRSTSPRKVDTWWLINTCRSFDLSRLSWYVLFSDTDRKMVMKDLRSNDFQILP